MSKRMLIDATHTEETRVVVLDGNRLADFDYESEAKKQLKGNVYLAKITRVEPSLQAAFVEYGGNRHGFLSFNEIHPDYYQIPIADRENLVADESETDDEEKGEEGNSVEVVGGDEIEEESERRRRPSYRGYKIQEVIKRRQIVLVQIVKEERGNKGAALTTYLSLAGRYCVLMPNTDRGGGISRKISNPADRKRLKGVLDGLKIPQGIAVIVRTAGAERSKVEIKRDYEYLMKQWDQIRELTLESTAPALINEEANLIKRSIRDLYSSQIDEVLVEGEEGYKLAKSFMKTLIPSHAVKVKAYKDVGMPIFHRYQVESQIDAIHASTVQLKSGGYIVMDATEALVAVDVNSGRSTRERNIEETALKTNMEAAEEVARQLRLRDLAGLIVIDFIDMENSRNIHAVERKLKESLRADRARIQVGRISHFGLLEMSRQRLRPSLAEASSNVCPHCGGTGHIRSIEATALHVLRALEEEGIRKRSAHITLHVPTKIALYILNQKRTTLAEIETRYDLSVQVETDDSLVPPDYRLERTRDSETAEAQPAAAGSQPAAPSEAPSDDSEASDGSRRKRRPRRRRSKRRDEETVESTENAAEPVEAAQNDEEGGESAAQPGVEASEGDSEGEPKKRRRRGRRGGRRRGRKPEDAETSEDTAVAAEANAGEVSAEVAEPEQATDLPEDASAVAVAVESTETVVAESAQEKEDANAVAAAVESTETVVAVPTQEETAAAPEPEPVAVKKPRRRRTAKAKTVESKTADGETADGEAVEAPAKPRRRRAPRKKPCAAQSQTTEATPAVTVESNDNAKDETVISVEVPQPVETPSSANGGASLPEAEPVPMVASSVEQPPEPDKPKRGGWWQKIIR